jgi:hypothetical protein
MTEQTVKTDLNKTSITSRLYSILNIACLAADYPEEKVDICQLQGAASGIGRLIQDLIDDIEE